MRLTINHAIYGCLLLGISATCAFAQSPDKPSNAEIIKRLNRIEQQFQNQGLLDMLQQLEHLQHEVNRLQGVIEQQNHSIEQLQNRQRALYSDVDQRIQNMGAAGDGGNTPTHQPPPVAPPLQTLSPITIADEPAATQQAETPLTIETAEMTASKQEQPQQTPVATAADVADPEAMAAPQPSAAQVDPSQIKEEYQQAFKLLKESQYDRAIKAFRKFLEAYPDNEYSDNAQYWVGETYFVTHEFKQALVEYDLVVNKFPNSKKIPHALLKKGYSYYELGQLDEAKAQLEELRQRFPGTTAARLARDRLNSMQAPE